MYQFFDTLTDNSGNALLGATVAVANYPSLTAATIYQSNGTTQPVANSTVVADITGQVSFFAPDGAYQLTYSYKGTPYKVRSPVQLMDPMGFVAATDTGGANALVVAGNQYPAQKYAGLKLEVKAAAANTGATTLTFQGDGGNPVKQPGGSALIGGMVQANGLVRFEWDGAQWELIGAQSQPFYAVTPAEQALAINVVNTSYQPGVVQRYGAVGDGVTDDTAAIQAAVNASANGTQKLIYIPSTLSGYKITAPIVINLPVTIYGDTKFNTVLSPATDISVFSLQSGAAHSTIRDLAIVGTNGGGNVAPAILFTNTHFGVIERVLIQWCGVGVRFAPGILSSFSNTIRDCFIASNKVINIDAQANSNNLTIIATTFGSAPIGLSFKDSAVLQITGGDCEGCTTAKIDIDSSSGTLPVAAVIEGVDFEGSAAAGGDIRLGNTNKVKGIVVKGCYFQPAGGANYMLNPVNADCVTFMNNTQVGGYASAVWINPVGNLTNLVVIQPDSTGDAQLITGTLAFSGGNNGSRTGRVAQARNVITYSASMAIDASTGNLFDITATNGVAFTVQSPTNAADGQKITITIRNTSGGALGALTFGAAYKASAWTQPANGFSRSITFRYDGTRTLWDEITRTTVDVPN